MKTARVTRILYPIGVLLFVVSYVFVHHRAEFSFPVPWPDESVFMWQAIAFKSSNSLLAPQLNPNQPIVLMAPGFAVLSGMVFKATGFSFDLARYLSTICVIAAFVILVFMITRYGNPGLSLLFCGLFLLGRSFVAAGNVARMEALLLLFVCAGFLLIQQKREYEGLALLGISPLFNPSAVVFPVAAGAYVLLVGMSKRTSLHSSPVTPSRRTQPGGRLLLCGRGLTKADAVAVLVALILWVVFVVYVGNHWQEFLQGISLQFGRFSQERQREILAGLLTVDSMSFLLLALFAFVYCLKRSMPVLFLLVIAMPAWFVNRAGLEMWYEVYDSLSRLLLAIVLIGVAKHLIETLEARVPKLAQRALFAISVGLLLVWGYSTGEIPSPTGYPLNLKWLGMWMPGRVRYIEDSDIAEISKYLTAAQSGEDLLRVQFYPEADGLFFYDLDGQSIRVWQPLFHSTKPDLYIVHLSRHLPFWWSSRNEEKLLEAGIDALNEEQVLYRRDQSEVWYYSRPDGLRDGGQSRGVGMSSPIWTGRGLVPYLPLDSR